MVYIKSEMNVNVNSSNVKFTLIIHEEKSYSHLESSS